MASPVNGLPGSLGTSPVLFPGARPCPRMALPAAPGMGSGGEQPHRLHPAGGPEPPPSSMPLSAPGARHGSPGALALGTLPVPCCSAAAQPGGTCFSPWALQGARALPRCPQLTPEVVLHLGPAPGGLSWVPSDCPASSVPGVLDLRVTNHCRFPRSEHLCRGVRAAPDVRLDDLSVALGSERTGDKPSLPWALSQSNGIGAPESEASAPLWFEGLLSCHC